VPVIFVGPDRFAHHRLDIAALRRRLQQSNS
jgi:hypothetical protein